MHDDPTPPTPPQADPPAEPPTDTAELDAARAALQGATADYTEAVKSANPDLPETVFTGADIAAVKANVANARAVADHVKATAAPPAAPVPPAPAPATPPPAAPGPPVSPGHGIDRIRAGLANRS